MNATDHVLRLLNIQHPIVQAPMAGVSTPALAAAVSEAGGLGSIAIGASDHAGARQMIEATRALTSRPFNVNVFCHRPAVADPAREAAWLAHLRPWFDAFGAQPPDRIKEIYKSFLDDRPMLEMLLQERPAVVSFHFGLPPADWVAALRDVGAVTFACVTSPAEAVLAETSGVDVLVAQGIEAGGHRGMFDPQAPDPCLSTLALLASLRERTGRPLVAAGGIMDGQGIARVLQAGAAAVQMGTAFVLCPESAANAAYREALSGPRAAHTALTAAISGRPARGLVNRMHTEVARPGAPALPDYPMAYDASKALNAAAMACGNHDFAVQWAGEGAPRARAMGAAELVRTLVREWQGDAAAVAGHPV